MEYVCPRRVETMSWPYPGEEQAVKTTILEDDATAKRATKLWARRNERKMEAGT